MIRATLAAILAFTLFVICHWLDFHYLIPYERVHRLLSMAILGLGCFSLLYYLLPQDEWFQTKLHLNPQRMRCWLYPLLGMLFYGFLLLGYLEFYFTAERSITFRMLMLTDKQADHRITQAQLLARYDVQGIINKRLDDLIYGGYLIKQGNEYQLTPKGYMTLWVYRITIDWLHLGTGEKDQDVKPTTTSCCHIH